jgi:hypothetical protein
MLTYLPDPASEADWAINAFLGALGAEPATAPLLERLRGRLDADFVRYEAKYCAWLPDEAARHALRQGIAVLTAYHTYQSTLARPALLLILQRCFVEPLRQTIRDATAHMLDQAEDPFTAIVAVAKLRQHRVFGRAFQFENPRDDQRACYLDVLRCLWHAFFAAEGCPELTAILCAFDHNWIGAIAPERHGVRFERALTLGTGGMLCPFHFFRVSRADAASQTGGSPAPAQCEQI